MTPTAPGTRTDSAWLAALAAAISPDVPVVSGPLLSVAPHAGQRRGQADAHVATGAVAVDMESAAIAAAAERHGLPFIAVRAVLDEAAQTVPSAIWRPSTNRNGGAGPAGSGAAGPAARDRDAHPAGPRRAGNRPTLLAVCRLGGPRFGLVG
jgi:hypothetical protein